MSFVAGDIFEECEHARNKTFVASQQSCSHYIFCDGEESYDGICADGDYFNEVLQTCDPKEMVNCSTSSTSLPVPTIMTRPPTTANPTTVTIRPPILSSTTSAATTLITITAPTAPTTTTSSGITTTVSSTTITNSDSNTTATSSTTSDADSNSSIASSSSSSTFTPTTTSIPSISINTECPASDNPYQITLLPHPKSCSDYFICLHGVPIPMHCSAMLHFDINSGKCDYPENVKCLVELTTPKENCQAHTVDLYPHPSNCNYFYFCKNGYLMLQQCPFYFGWDFEKRTCVALNQAKCYNKRNRA